LSTAPALVLLLPPPPVVTTRRALPPRQTLLAEHVASTAELNDLLE